LWAAAASDPTLRTHIVPMEERIGREIHRATVELLGVDESVPGARETVQATLDLARGLGLAHLLTDDTARRRRIVQQWARMLELELHHCRGASTHPFFGPRTTGNCCVLERAFNSRRWPPRVAH